MNPAQLAQMDMERRREGELQLGTTGTDLGNAVGLAIRQFIVTQAAAALANAPDWKASIEHLADYVQQQIGSLAGRVTSIDQRVRNLETIVASLPLPAMEAPGAP